MKGARGIKGASCPSGPLLPPPSGAEARVRFYHPLLPPSLRGGGNPRVKGASAAGARRPGAPLCRAALKTALPRAAHRR